MRLCAMLIIVVVVAFVAREDKRVDCDIDQKSVIKKVSGHVMCLGLYVAMYVVFP